MKAALYRSTGPAAEVLTVEDVDRPDPGPGEVLVRVHASGINPTDWKSRAGATARPVDGFQIPHHDGAGVIEAVGEGVGPGRVGQRVWIWFAAFGRRWGTAAEYCVVPARNAVPLPDGATFDLGASLGVPAMTAHYCLFCDGPVDGKTVLVAGGAGAVGHFAINLAKRAGARVVSTVSSEQKAALASAAGADLVVNYREAGAAEQIQAFAPAVDRVIEVALGANLALDLAVAAHGTVVTYAAEASDPVVPVRACMTANIALRFMLMYVLPAAALDAAVSDITAALAAGDLTELPVHKFALTDIVAAQQAAEAGVTGKIIVTPLCETYFFGYIPVWLVPPKNTCAPQRSRRPVPSQCRQRRYEYVNKPPKCLPVILQTGHFRSGWMRRESRYTPTRMAITSSPDMPDAPN